jgi:hypothetical protein
MSSPFLDNDSAAVRAARRGKVRAIEAEPVTTDRTPAEHDAGADTDSTISEEEMPDT